MHINGYIACYMARETVVHVARAALHSLPGRLNTGGVTSYIHTCDVSHISLIYIIYITYVPIYIDLIIFSTTRIA